MRSWYSFRARPSSAGPLESCTWPAPIISKQWISWPGRLEQDRQVVQSFEIADLDSPAFVRDGPEVTLLLEDRTNQIAAPPSAGLRRSRHRARRAHAGGWRRCCRSHRRSVCLTGSKGTRLVERRGQDGCLGRRRNGVEERIHDVRTIGPGGHQRQPRAATRPAHRDHPAPASARPPSATWAVTASQLSVRDRRRSLGGSPPPRTSVRPTTGPSPQRMCYGPLRVGSAPRRIVSRAWRSIVATRSGPDLGDRVDRRGSTHDVACPRRRDRVVVMPEPIEQGRLRSFGARVSNGATPALAASVRPCYGMVTTSLEVTDTDVPRALRHGARSLARGR